MSVSVEPSTRSGFGFAAYLRQVAAVGCAAVVTGALVAFPGGRLVMRLLALLNPEDTGQVTDDGFLVGRISLGGSGQLLLAAVQISMLGAVIFLLVRPLLLGPRWLRTTTLAVGVATTVAALLVTPQSFDFLVLEPRWLPIALFWLLPAVHVVVFATLAEHWLADDSWFARAPLSKVRWTLLLWLLAGAALVLAVPLVAMVLAGVLLLRRFPVSSSTANAARWAGRAALVVIFVGAVVDLARDTQQLVG